MPRILTDTAWNSSQQSKYHAKLLEYAKNNWAAYLKRSPVLAIQLIINQKQRNGASKASRIQYDAVAACLQNMLTCSADKPCGIFRCRRCAARLLLQTVQQVSNVISQYTTTRRGVAIAIGVGSDRWNGELHQRKFTVLQEIHTLQTILNSIPDLDGHRLALDIAAFKTPNGIRYQLHLHGTLLYRGREIEQLENTIDHLLVLHNLDLNLWIKPIEGHWKSNGPGRPATLCNKSETARWICYSEKLSTYRADGNIHTELHAELHNLPTCWTGGLLLARHPVEARRERQLSELKREIADLVNLQYQYQIGDRFINQIANLQELINKIEALNHLRHERERKRHARRQAAYAKQRHTFNANTLPDVRTRWRANSQARRAKFKERLENQLKLYRSLWKDLMRGIAGVMRQTIKSVARKHDQLAQHFTHYVESATLQARQAIRQPLLTSVVAICSTLVSMRKRMVDYIRLAGIAEQRSDELLEASDILEKRLRELNEYWPAIAPTERCYAVDHRKFWSAWRRLIFRYL